MTIGGVRWCRRCSWRVAGIALLLASSRLCVIAYGVDKGARVRHSPRVARAAGDRRARLRRGLMLLWGGVVDVVAASATGRAWRAFFSRDELRRVSFGPPTLVLSRLVAACGFLRVSREVDPALPCRRVGPLKPDPRMQGSCGVGSRTWGPPLVGDNISWGTSRRQARPAGTAGSASARSPR